MFKDISGQQWCDLVDYLYKRCDVVTFQVPNYSIYVYNNKNGICEPCDFRREIKEEFLNKHQAYMENIRYTLDSIKDCIISKVVDNEYFGNIYEHETTTYVLKLNTKVSKILKGRNSLYSWDYPNMPQDLHFFSKGRTWFYTQAMDQIYGFFIYSKKEIECLKLCTGLDVEMLDEGHLAGGFKEYLAANNTLHYSLSY